jgi:uncharacterized protein YdhG (YjbR/CyaY superfamily)/uncharacterized protein (DUF1697 family)
MPELRIALAEAGLVDVRTYIQSGNVIARSNLDDVRTGHLVHDTIARSIGADVTVITRTPRQIQSILERCPFPAADSARTYFSLLSARPAPEARQRLLETDCAPDQISIVADTIYTLYATKHSDSRFNNNYFERKLKVAATTRNFNTMTRLAELSTGKAGRPEIPGGDRGDRRRGGSMKAEQATPATIDEYIAACPPEVRPVLQRIRATIRKAAPGAVERISYRLPTFTLKGDLVYFGAFKKHIGLYPPVRDAELKLEAAIYAGEKGNVRFPLDKPIPYALIARIVRARMKENLIKAAVKRKKA